MITQPTASTCIDLCSNTLIFTPCACAQGVEQSLCLSIRGFVCFFVASCACRESVHLDLCIPCSSTPSHSAAGKPIKSFGLVRGYTTPYVPARAETPVTASIYTEHQVSKVKTYEQIRSDA